MLLMSFYQKIITPNLVKFSSSYRLDIKIFYNTKTNKKIDSNVDFFHSFVLFLLKLIKLSQLILDVK